MTVKLTFDVLVDLKFLVPHLLPLELKQRIGEQKNEIHASLSPDPKSRRRLVGSREFTLENGDKFLVFFVSDIRQPSSELQPLEVTYIEKVRPRRPAWKG